MRGFPTLPILLALLLGLLLAAPASAARVGPERDLRGPELLTPAAELDAALNCTADIGSSDKQAVLLVHGTAANEEENWGWNYTQILPSEGYPVCTVRIPGKALSDLQMNAEFVVNAIRETYRRSGEKIAVLGHSQGAFLPTFGLRFWPDLKRKIDDFVGFAGAYTYGTDMANLICATPATCTGAFWQFTPGSNLLGAVPKGRLPRLPSYTAYLTLTDEVVTPQPMASTLEAPGARNFTLQDLCPADVAEHILIPGSQVLVDLTLDALSHPGPASLERVGRIRCGLIPTAAEGAPAAASFIAGIITEGPKYTTDREPELRCYLAGTCEYRFRLKLRCNSGNGKLRAYIRGDLDQVRNVRFRFGGQTYRRLSAPKFQVRLGPRRLERLDAGRRAGVRIAPATIAGHDIALTEAIPPDCRVSSP